MTSKKRCAQQKQIRAFKAQFSADTDTLDALFAYEEHQQINQAERHEAILQKKTCTSKNRYKSQKEAQAAIAACADFGTRGLHTYRCPYCDGWHLSSKPYIPS